MDYEKKGSTYYELWSNDLRTQKQATIDEVYSPRSCDESGNLVLWM